MPSPARSPPRPVAHLLCNRQMLPVVLDGLAEAPLRPIRAPEVRVRPARSPTSFAIARCCPWCSMALLKSPCDRNAHPRFAYAVGFAAVRVSARAAATQSPLCPAFHALIWQQQRERCGLGRATVRHLRECLSMCVSVCVRACACAQVPHIH